MMQQLSISSKADFIKAILPENWEEQIADANFSSDDLINAYVKGKADGETQVGRIIMDRFTENINKATKLAEQFIQLAKGKGIHVVSAHLKVDDLTKFTILFVVSEEVYLSDNFRNMYVLANVLKSTSSTNLFSAGFTFTYQSEHLSKECLSSDGYIMRYGDTGKA